MKAWPIDPPLLLRLDRAGQGGQKLVFRLDDVQIGLEVIAELADHPLLFVLAEQTVIDEDAGELRADGLGQQRGDDRGIDPAGKPADHAIAADAAADGFDGLAGEIAELPRAGATAHRLEEVAEDLRALRRVRHLGMKLQTVERQPPVLHRGHRAGVGGGQRLEIGRRLRHLIAVAHPDVDLAGNAGEQFVGLRDAAPRPAVLARRRALHRAAERLAGQMQAVADAQAPAGRGGRCPGSHFGAPGSYTLAGPPDRISPLGASSRIRSAVMSCRTISQ